MSWEEQGENPLEDAGYEKDKRFEDISAFDADNEQIVYASSNKIVSIRKAEDEVITNRLSVSVEDPIEDIATGQSSSTYLLVDGDLRSLSTMGEVSDPWEKNITQIVSPNHNKIVVFVDETGDIHGFEDQNRLPKFQGVSFTDEDGDKVEPELIGGKVGFLAFGGSILRSYDQRGNVRWEAEFDADIVGVAQRQDDYIVGLSNDSIHWIDSKGERTMDIGGSLDCISAVGYRMVIGSVDGNLTAFGDSPVAPTISEYDTSNVVQTSGDNLVGLINESTLELYRQKAPTVQLSVVANGDREESGTLQGKFNNPYPIKLQLEIEVDRDTEDETIRESVFLPPNSERSEKVEISNINLEDKANIAVKSRDGRIVAYDGLVRAQAPESVDENKKEEQGHEADQTQEISKGSSEEQEQPDGTVQGKNIGEEAASKDFESVDLNTADDLQKESDEETGEEENRSDVSVSLELVSISNSVLTWEIEVENRTSENIIDLTVEETNPVKFSIDGSTSSDIVTAGSSFVTRGAMPYRPTTVKVGVSWTDSDGEEHGQTVEEKIPDKFFEASAERFSNDDQDRVEFTLRNHLGVEIHDTIEITAIEGSRTRHLGQHRITLKPGINTITRHLSSRMYESPYKIESHRIKLQYLSISDVCDANSSSRGSPAGDSEQMFDRDIRIKINEDQKSKICDIDNVPLSQRSPTLIQEKIVRKNNSKAWLPAKSLWSKISDGWEATDEIISSVQSKEIITLQRFWQTVRNEGSLTLNLPAHRLGESGPEISARKCKLIPPRVTMLCAFIPVGPNRDWRLFVRIKNKTTVPVQLDQIQFENGSSVSNQDNHNIRAKSNQTFYFNLPEKLNPKKFSGVAQAKMTTKIGETSCRAVVITQNNPIVDRSRVWFDAGVQLVEGETTETLRLTLKNTHSEEIRKVSVLPHSKPGTGVGSSSFPPGESISISRQVNKTLPESLVLEEGTIYKITAEKDGQQSSDYVRIEPREDTDQKFEAKILPSESNIDTQAMIESWPEQFATGWRYNVFVNSSESQAKYNFETPDSS